ncbi:MAG: UDP-N-acetylmuramate dehydrogenase [Thermomicrobiales bacterium]|nr:UDP-N-acetylmuramate dehydrogenase [Thermomicrobiales bacterium]
MQIPGDTPLKVVRDTPMSRYTTWRIGGPADYLIRAGTTDELVAAVRWGAGEGLPIYVIGGGSNLLVGDRGIRGLVITARTPGERAEHLLTAEDGGDSVLVSVAAQAPLSWTGRYCSERGWAGMDWGVGLPGAIGGATVNNAGAHGTEQKDHLHSVTLLGHDGAIEIKDAAWVDSRYRMTRLKEMPHPRPWTVLGVQLALPKGDPEELRRQADAHAEYRKATQPTGRCAGSTFTNPPGDFAGRLLEAAGLKDFAVGGVRFSSIHSNFIVNDGTATAADVRELIALARERIRAEFGIDLHPEIEEIGER